VAPDLDPDSLVDALTREGPEPDVVPLSGFLGRSPDGHTRLFLDPELKVWVDVPEDQVVHRHRNSDERGRFGASSMIWVRGRWMRRSLLTKDQRDAIAREFLIGEFALGAMLPETFAEALDAAAMYVGRTTMHTRHCPR
jgi:hypothetical protein